MNFEIDFTTRTPIYLQLIVQVKQAISNGDLKHGEQLPTVRHLADDLRVNFNTIARAYRALDDEGVISTQHGRGTYILEPGLVPKSMETSRQELEVLADHFVKQAMQLSLNADEVLLLISQRLPDDSQ
jgi:GntR family transcriptional regulator